MKKLAILLALVCLPLCAVASSLSPIEANLSGAFHAGAARYSLSIRVNPLSLIPSRFELVVDGHVLPISASDFAAYDGLDISTITVTLDREDFVAHGNEILVAPSGMLQITLKARKARACASGYMALTISVDTANDYALAIAEDCVSANR